MTTPNYSGPRTGTGQTIGLTSATPVSFDLAAAGPFGAIDNAMITILAIVQGFTAAGDAVRFTVQRSFTRLSGTVVALDGATIVLGTTFASAPLAAATTDIAFSGTTINIGVTGVTGETITWTVAMWLYGTSF